MKTRLVMAFVAAIAVLALVFPAAPAAAKNTIYINFEKTLSPFASMMNPATGFAVVRTLGDNGCSDKGQAYANLQTSSNGSYKVFWMGATFPAEDTEMIRLQLSARDTGNCATCTPVAFAGAIKPAWPGDFRPLALDSTDGPSTGGWLTYSFQNVVKTNGSVFVGIGWSPPNDITKQFASQVRNESLLDNPSNFIKGSFGFDCIDLSIFPAP